MSAPVSKRIDKSWLVFASIENPQHDRCVDLFRRPDGTYGFEEFRRDPEDAGEWTPVRIAFDPTVLIPAEKTISGSHVGSLRPRIDIPRYVEMYLRGQLDLDQCERGDERGGLGHNGDLHRLRRLRLLLRPREPSDRLGDPRPHGDREPVRQAGLHRLDERLL